MPEKNANSCYSYLSRKVWHNEAGTTLHLGDIVFPKQLDELYPIHTPTASAEDAGVDVGRAPCAKLLAGQASIFFRPNFCWQTLSSEQKPVSEFSSMHLNRYSLVTPMPTPSAEAVGLCIG